MANNIPLDPEFQFEVGQVSYWKFTDPKDENYRTQISGDVVALIKEPETDFKTKQPKLDDQGNMLVQWTVCLAQPNGKEIRWVLRNKNCQWAILNALKAQGLAASNFGEIAGYNITVTTEDGVWGKENPRPFAVTINGIAATPWRGYVNKMPNYAPRPVNPVQQVQQAQTQVQQAVQQAYQAAQQPPASAYDNELDGYFE